MLEHCKMNGTACGHRSACSTVNFFLPVLIAICFSMKEAILIIGILVITIISALIAIFLNPDRLTPDNPAGKAKYYTVVKNADVKIDSDKRYEYVLDAYDEKGDKKVLTFTASKQLREGAYLELYVTPLRGVTYW